MVLLTLKFHLRGPNTPADPTGNSCNTSARSPLSSHMTNHRFSAGFRAISQGGHDRSSAEKVKHTPSHPTQAYKPAIVLDLNSSGPSKITGP